MSNLPAVPFDELQRMGLAIAKSGLFGAKSPEQAISLLLIAQAEGRHPALAAQDYDIIGGRAAKRSASMMRDFIQAGGSVQWHALTDEVADATFSHPQGGKVRIHWDMARAKRAGLANKDNYLKYPRAMLRSRCISEGCKTVYPAATSGMYTPEEVRDMEPITVKSSAERMKEIDAEKPDYIPGLKPQQTVEQVFNTLKDIPNGMSDVEKMCANLDAAGHKPYADKLAAMALEHMKAKEAGNV